MIGQRKHYNRPTQTLWLGNANVIVNPHQTPLEEWIAYLKNGGITADATAPGLPEAREKLKYYNMSPKERHVYDEHINALMIQNDVLDTAKLERRAEGLEEGKAKEKMDIARNMKSLGIDSTIICQVTGLTPEDIHVL